MHTIVRSDYLHNLKTPQTYGDDAEATEKLLKPGFLNAKQWQRHEKVNLQKNNTSPTLRHRVCSWTFLKNGEPLPAIVSFQLRQFGIPAVFYVHFYHVYGQYCWITLVPIYLLLYKISILSLKFFMREKQSLCTQMINYFDLTLRCLSWVTRMNCRGRVQCTYAQKWSPVR